MPFTNPCWSAARLDLTQAAMAAVGFLGAVVLSGQEDPVFTPVSSHLLLLDPLSPLVL